MISFYMRCVVSFMQEYEQDMIVMKRTSKCKIYIFIGLVFVTCCCVYKTYHSVTLGRTYLLNMNFKDTTPLVSHLRRHSSNITELCSLPEVRTFRTKIPSKKQYMFFNKTSVCYCVVPKSASTSLVRYMMIKEHPEKTSYYKQIAGSAIHTLPELPVSKPNACATGSNMSFFVARNPYERLFSAYIDKIFLEKFRQIAHAIDLLKRRGQTVFNTHDTIYELLKNDAKRCAVTNVSFEGFLQYILRQKILDTHFAPITSLCNPCDHHFDLILKQESLYEDMQRLTNYLQQGDSSSTASIPLTNYSGTAGIKQTTQTYFMIKRVSDMTMSCNLTDEARLYTLNKRIWDALIMLGNIDDSVAFNNSWFKSPATYTGRSIADSLIQNLATHGIQPLTEEQRDKQRNKYLRQAYENISPKTIEHIQMVYRMDFLLLGYDVEPPT